MTPCIYRWWRSALLYPFPEHPCDGWLRSEREESGLYPDSWIDDLRPRGSWVDCPWWLDYPDKEYPVKEAHSYFGELGFDAQATLTLIWIHLN